MPWYEAKFEHNLFVCVRARMIEVVSFLRLLERFSIKLGSRIKTMLLSSPFTLTKISLYTDFLSVKHFLMCILQH